MLCPNCYAYLKPRMEEVKVVSIYEKLEEFGIGKKNLFPARCSFHVLTGKERTVRRDRAIHRRKADSNRRGTVLWFRWLCPCKRARTCKNMGAALKIVAGRRFTAIVRPVQAI